MPSARCLILQHEAGAPAGLLEPWAAARDVELHTARLDLDGGLPAPRTYDFAVVLGATPSVNDATVPWITAELSWLREADAAGVPLLGICFGAQAIAAALGGTVRRAPRTELGWVTIDVESDGVGAGPWLSWHRDTIDPPPGARLLARNGHGVQAYDLGPHLAVQFHPEATPQILDTWIAESPDELAELAIDADELRAESARHVEGARTRAVALFDGFLERTRLSRRR